MRRNDAYVGCLCISCFMYCECFEAIFMEGVVECMYLCIYKCMYLCIYVHTLARSWICACAMEVTVG